MCRYNTMASGIRRQRGLTTSRWYIKAARDFVDIPATVTHASCEGAAAAAEARASAEAKTKATSGIGMEEESDDRRRRVERASLIRASLKNV